MIENPKPDIWNPMSNVIYYAEDNAEALKQINDAISTLYSLQEAIDSLDLNNSATVEARVEELDIDVTTWAEKLETMRSLRFGEAIFWRTIQQMLEQEVKEAKDERPERT